MFIADQKSEQTLSRTIIKQETDCTFAGTSQTDPKAVHNGEAKLVIVMVGLPARGKSYIVKKLARYLNWLHFKTRVFNAGQRRRCATSTQPGSLRQISSAAFFDPSDPKCVAARDAIALDTLDELLQWLQAEDGCVGILDATNTTLERRQLVIERISRSTRPLPELLFLESYSFDASIIQQNVLLKLAGPDYFDKEPSWALEDFLQRMTHYEMSYVPIGTFEEQNSLPYVRMVDVGRKIETHLIHGFKSTQIVEYLLNFNLAERQIWLTCNGQSCDDIVGKIGRRSNLSLHGSRFATALAKFVQEQRKLWERARNANRVKETPAPKFPSKQAGLAEYRRFCVNEARRALPSLTVWTSTMPQAIQTAAPFSDRTFTKLHLKALDDLNAGDVAGFTFDEIAQLHPKMFSARQHNKLYYRWPGLGGEAYIDVISRLRPIIIELERVENHVLIVTHRAIVRALLGYFRGVHNDALAASEIPNDCVFCLEPVSDQDYHT